MEIVKTNFNYKHPLILLDLSKVLFIVIHHTASTTASPLDIHNWHLENGWNGFGYNEYIRKNGTVYIGRGDNIGAHTANMNSKSYGICCEGNYAIEKNAPDAQVESLINRLMYHKNRLKNLTEITPHSKFVSTGCPGNNFPLNNIITETEHRENTFINAIKILEENNIINTPSYWLNNAIPGKLVLGEYANILIRNMFEKLDK